MHSFFRPSWKARTRLFSTIHQIYESPSSSYSSRIIDVSFLAAEMRQSVRAWTSAHKRHGQPPIKLAGVMANGPERLEAEKYSAFIQATFEQDGLDYELFHCDFEPQAVEATIHTLNQCDDVDGILVFYPLFPQRTLDYGKETQMSVDHTTGVHFRKALPPIYLNSNTGVYYKTIDDYLRDCVIPSKDVEGLCHTYKASWQKQLFRSRGGTLRSSNDIYIPCTARAVMKILEEYHPEAPVDSSLNQTTQKRWSNTTATVINRSSILGHPLAGMLALGGATVFSVDERSIIRFDDGGKMSRCHDTTVDDCLRRSQVVVTAVPVQGYAVDYNSVADFATVVNVSEHENIDVGSLLTKKRGIRFVPSVGKITIAALEQALLKLP